MIIAIVQARLDSKRLPNKCLLSLKGLSVIEWIYKRLKKRKRIQKLIFAIPENKINDSLEISLKKIGANVIRGSNENVLSRYNKCLLVHKNITHIIRVCADRPLVDWGSIDLLVQEHLASKADYSYNHYPLENNWPIGFGAEICSYETFKKIYKNAKTKLQKEHIFNYLVENPNRFKIHTFDTNMGVDNDIKLDLDTYDDYLRLIQLNINSNMPMGKILSEVGAGI